MKIYKIRLFGNFENSGELYILGTEEDVVRIVRATAKGVRLVRVRGSLINPSNIASITRAWNARVDELEGDDVELGKIGSDVKQIQ